MSVAGVGRTRHTIVFAALLALSLAATALIGSSPAPADAAAPNVSLAGVHWYSGDSSMLDSSIPLGERGWNVEVIFEVEWCDGDPASDPGGVRSVAQVAKDHGLVNIIRVDYRHLLAVPANAADFPGWASDFIRCTSELSDVASIYIVGNEPNIEGNLSAAHYAAAFNYLLSRRGELPVGTELLAAFNSPFTPTQWMRDMSAALNGVDGFAMHTGGIRSHCQDPRQPCSFGGWTFDGAFRYYRDVIEQIDRRWWGRPVYITEFNTYTGDPGSEPQNNYIIEWINRAFEDVRNYNAGRGNKPQVRALAWFVDRPQSWPLWSLRNIGAARADMMDEFKNPANRPGGPVPTLTPTPTSGPVGPLQNGAFEGGVQGNGVGEAWSSFASSGYGASFGVVTDGVHSGAKAQQVRSQPSANNQYAGVFQSVATTPGASYTVRAWNRVSLPGGSGWPLVARLGIDPSGGTDYTAGSVSWAEFDAPENGVGDWELRERSVTASGTSMTIFLQSWRKWTAAGASDTWFDDVEVLTQGGTPPTSTPTSSTPTPTLSAPTPTPTPSPDTPFPTATMPPFCPPALDFAAIRQELNRQGQDLAFVKIGFHAGPGGNHNGLGEWEQCLDAAGVPFFLKSVDNAGKILEGAQLREASGVPHVLVYRKAGFASDGYWYDVPDTSLSPFDAAVKHWRRHTQPFPPELQPYKDWFWLETINEVDKNNAEWYGEFAYHTAQFAMAEGFNWAAFGWSSGEPEPVHWQGPWMVKFLELAAANPDRIALALHEYSYDGDSLKHGLFESPALVGRFQGLYEVTDGLGLPRPTVLITEFGWEATNVPSPAVALDADGDPEVDNLPWAAELYAGHPSVEGAAIWYLGGGFGGIANDAQRLIRPLLEYTLQTYFTIPLADPWPIHDSSIDGMNGE